MKQLTELTQEDGAAYEQDQAYLFGKKNINFLYLGNPEKQQELVRLLDEYEKSHEIR